jgi:PTH1 family peptidyl-tRNA hydrolase
MEPGLRLCVIGLGNPGAQYARTRHNVGFHVVDRLADVLHIRKFAVHPTHLLAETKRGDWSVLLCKPTTFMNRSGDAVVNLHRTLGIDFSELLVVYDDVSLPLGVLRLRRRGSDGGHNGLSSILHATNSASVARLRCGIGSFSSHGDLADFVLRPFETEEVPRVDAMTATAADAVLAVMDDGWSRAMNVYNTIQPNKQDSI